jgi:hypothetical protein
VVQATFMHTTAMLLFQPSTICASAGANAIAAPEMASSAASLLNPLHKVFPERRSYDRTPR